MGTYCGAYKYLSNLCQHLATLQHIVMDFLAALALEGSSLTLGFNGTTDDGDFQLRRKFPWRNQTRRKSFITTVGIAHEKFATTQVGNHYIL